MERTSTQLKRILALFAAVLILSALAAIGAVWIPQPELNPFATNGELIGYSFALHSAGFFGNWGTVAIFVAAVALVGTLTFWLVLRAFRRPFGPQHP